MKVRFLSLIGLVLCAACSTSKVAYKFDYHDYNAGRKAKEIRQEVASNPGPVAIQPEQVVAEAPITSAETTSIESTPAKAAPVAKSFESMTKNERKATLKEFKKEVKKVNVKRDGVESVQATQAIDRDLKLAAIFGAVGIVGLIIGGQVFYIIGGIALIIGVVFFVRWLIRQ